ncbi:MAG: M1 family metallopeptidase [Bacteroidetes bacterium]|nr:M1 family metallopeptidase [Bacteroidota bacterium]
MKQLLLLFVCLFNLTLLFSQNHHSRFESIDIQDYIFEIHLNDSTNKIEGKTTVQIKFLKSLDKITLDLVGSNDSTATGMVVKNVYSKGFPLNFNHSNNQLEIQFSEKLETDKIATIEIEYSGIPADGLIISRNKFGDRTFFGDNWPNRARHWLPTVDHPSDKSTLHFIVDAPRDYNVISNGSLQEIKILENNLKRTIWNENLPISTKLMVIGVARFAVQNDTLFEGTPVSSWVFPQNQEDGFKDYQNGTKSLEYFSNLIGPYSYEKLAHVQSKTQYGGMENATCIFYSEKTVNGKNEQERLFAHETAHQWFGNSVTEQNWHHIWLSEGFATYFTHVYNQNFYGEEVFRNGLKKDKERVIKYAGKYLAPIIDTTVTNYIQLLNANSYQKASWFLHMLRNKLGDEVFFKGIQKYYIDFQNSTALTKDFREVMEKTSGLKLDSFFRQWLFQPGHPKLKVDWKQKSNKKLALKINQMQAEYLFTFPLEVEVQFKSGKTRLENLNISDSKSAFYFELKNEVESVKLDPNFKLLFEKIQ